MDGLYSDNDYKRQKRLMEDRLAGLLVPEADAATPGERRRLLLTMLDAVYVDAKEEHRVVAIRSKPPFRPLLEIATTRPDSGVELYVLEKETPAAWGEQQALSGPCFWWRRGRVELPVQRIPQQNMLQV